MKTLFLVFEFALIFVATAYQDLDERNAETSAEKLQSSDKYKRSSETYCRISEQSDNNGQGSNCLKNRLSPEAILEQQKTNLKVNQLTGQQRKVQSDLEEFETYMRVAKFYMMLPIEQFELAAFNKALGFPFFSNITRLIVQQIAEFKPATEQLLNVEWTEKFPWVEQFGKISNANSKKAIGKNYPKFVQDYTSALSNLQQLLKSSKPSKSDSELRGKLERFQISCQSFHNNRNEKTIFLDSLFAVVLETLNDPKLERERLFEVIKATLGFMIGTTLIQEACAIYPFFKTKFITELQWHTSATLMNAFDQNQELMNSWQDEIKTYLDKYQYDGEWNADEIRRYQLARSGLAAKIKSDLGSKLKEKYYWNVFSVIVDDSPISVSEYNIAGYEFNPMLRDASKKTEVSATGVKYWRLENKISPQMGLIYVVWAPFKHSKEYNPPIVENATPASSSRPTLDPTRLSTSGHAEKAEKCLTAVQTGLETFKGLGKNVKMLANYKDILKSIGAFAKYAGPIAAAVCSAVSAFLEPGAADIINALRDGFKEMHDRFDVIENLLHEMGSVVALANAEQDYNNQIRKWVDSMNLTMANYLENHCQSIPLRELHCMCNEIHSNPHKLINTIYGYFELPNGFAQKLFVAAEYDINSLRKNLMRIVGDASELTTFYATMCLPILAPGLAHKIKSSTMNGQWLTNIINEANRLDTQIIIEWPEEMQKDVTKLINNKPADSSVDQQELAHAIHTKLTDKYWWNQFHVFVFKNTVTDIDYIRQRQLIHPGYSRHVRVANWDVVINWWINDDIYSDDESDELKSNAERVLFNALTEKVMQSHCQNDRLSQAFLTSKAVRDANVATMFIRRDLEKITYYGIPSWYNSDNNGQWPLEDKSILYVEHSCYKKLPTVTKIPVIIYEHYKIKYIFNLGDI